MEYFENISIGSRGLVPGVLSGTLIATANWQTAFRQGHHLEECRLKKMEEEKDLKKIFKKVEKIIEQKMREGVKERRRIEEVNWRRRSSRTSCLKTLCPQRSVQSAEQFPVGNCAVRLGH